MKKGIIILGSTGSIGRSTLEVIASQPDDFELIGLSCRENVQLFNEQIRRFRPRFACVSEGDLADRVAFGSARRLTGPAGMKDLVRVDGEMIVNALPGTIGLEPTIEALTQGKVLALANKESLVMAGRLISRLVSGKGATLLPIDSEHSALYQLMQGMKRDEIEALVVTASGGPFRNLSAGELRTVTAEQALCHPTWQMGRKVTIDSATLMNKGLEVIEARWLFDMDGKKIRVVVHPESIVHGMVHLVDGSVFAYMAYPDMKIPIAFALNGGERKTTPFGKVDLVERGALTFYAPDTERFPALRLAYEALGAGDGALITLNAANELASSAFVDGRIGFTDIPRLVEEALQNHPVVKEIDDLAAIWEMHGWATNYVQDRLRRMNDY
ncbi:MAG: 1-deoxy-D-xylulose-5-phosphate reductoisomerase [Syntrophorhabdales bacterium]|jgi:1-deoxy-D-xylulose-5-phosphate reductoisomerase